MSVLKQYKQPVEQKELAVHVMSKASRTLPDGGEMLHEGGTGSIGASAATGSVGSGPAVGKVYFANPCSFLPVNKRKTFCTYILVYFKNCVTMGWKRTISNHSDVAKCFLGSFQMVTMHKIFSVAFLSLNSLPSSSF